MLFYCFTVHKITNTATPLHNGRISQWEGFCVNTANAHILSCFLWHLWLRTGLNSTHTHRANRHRPAALHPWPRVLSSSCTLYTSLSKRAKTKHTPNTARYKNTGTGRVSTDTDTSTLVVCHTVSDHWGGLLGPEHRQQSEDLLDLKEFFHTILLPLPSSGTNYMPVMFAKSHRLLLAHHACEKIWQFGGRVYWRRKMAL